MTAFETYGDIGRYLMDCRESLNQRLEQAAKDLKIRAKYLTALEEGKVDELPSLTYAKGYVKRYAEYLGLNELELLDAFDHISGKAKTEKFYVPVPTRKHNTPSTHIFILSTVLVVFFYALWTFVGSSSSVPTQQVQTLPERYARLIDPTQLPQYTADVRWRDCFTPLVAEKAACQDILALMHEPVDEQTTLLTQERQFSTRLRLPIKAPEAKQ